MSDAFAVEYADAGRVHPVFQCIRESRLAFDVVLERLRSGILAEDLLILHEIDPQMILRKGGYAIGRMHQLLFFHPRFMARLLNGEPSALPEAPLKFSMIAGSDSRVFVRWQDPAPSFARYEVPALAELGIELARLTMQIVDGALEDLAS